MRGVKDSCRMNALVCMSCFFFNDTATTEIYTLSLHDALPISMLHNFKHYGRLTVSSSLFKQKSAHVSVQQKLTVVSPRSEEHTSELQSRQYLVCRLLLEKKKYHLSLSHITHIPHFYQNSSLSH